MFEEQNRCCKICGIHRNNLKSSLHVDHNHNTGKIRGLLCHKCNRGIGYLNDDINLLTKVIDYLKKYD